MSKCSYADAEKLKAYITCKKCGEKSWVLLHVEYVAFGFEVFGRCPKCKRKHEVEVHNI